MIQSDPDFLPGVTRDYVLERLKKAGGHEVKSGKLVSPGSSAALAVNTFGWFHDRPERLPPFPPLGDKISSPSIVEVEYCARFPWRGGRHPWLDAWAETSGAMVGIESKRFEPFRRKVKGMLSPAYDRAWYDRMVPFEEMRNRLRSPEEHFRFLDAVQLVKHAFGLVTQGRKRGKRPYLVYLYAEPLEYAGHSIPEADRRAHREEIARFSAAVGGAEVVFAALSYRQWLAGWPDSDQELAAHRAAIIERFQP